MCVRQHAVQFGVEVFGTATGLAEFCAYQFGIGAAGHVCAGIVDVVPSVSPVILLMMLCTGMKGPQGDHLVVAISKVAYYMIII